MGLKENQNQKKKEKLFDDNFCQMKVDKPIYIFISRRSNGYIN